MSDQEWAHQMELEARQMEEEEWLDFQKKVWQGRPSWYMMDQDTGYIMEVTRD